MFVPSSNSTVTEFQTNSREVEAWNVTPSGVSSLVSDELS